MGDQDPILNPMDEYSISEVDWGAHDPSYMLYLVHIDLDAKPKDFFTQELWGELSQKTSSTPLIGLNHVEGKLVHHLAVQKGPNRLDHHLDQQWDPTQSLDHLLSSSDHDPCPSPCQSFTITVFLKKMGRGLTSTSLMAYLKYSCGPNQSSIMEVHTLFLTLNNMQVVTIYLPNGILGRNLCNLHSSGNPYLPRSFIFFGFSLSTILVAC